MSKDPAMTREQSDALAVRQIKDLQQSTPWPGVPAGGARPERSAQSSSGIRDQEGGAGSSSGQPRSPSPGPGVPGAGGTGERLGGHTDRPAKMPPLPPNDPSKR